MRTWAKTWASRADSRPQQGAPAGWVPWGFLSLGEGDSSGGPFHSRCVASND